MENNRQCARLALVTAFCLGAAACQLDSPTGSPVVAEPVLRIAERAADGLDASGNCTGCVVGPVTFVRDPGAPRSETLTFSAVAGTMYMVDLDDLGSRGADASVMLNDDTLLTPRGTGNASTQHFSDSVRLTDRNTLVVRLVGKPGSKLRVAIWTETPFVITGIRDIRTFLERCPTNDAAYVQIRRDFELRADGQVVTADIPCSEPYSLLPIDQLTDELVTLQVLRTAYYMSQGTEGKLPWTQKALYVWMSSNVAGVNLKTSPGQLYCCDVARPCGYVGVLRSRNPPRRRRCSSTHNRMPGISAPYRTARLRPNLRPQQSQRVRRPVLATVKLGNGILEHWNRLFPSEYGFGIRSSERARGQRVYNQVCEQSPTARDANATVRRSVSRIFKH